MTQATTWSVPLVGPATPTVMAQRTDDSFDALLSGNSGAARPSYAVPGMVWEDTSVAGETRFWFYDGTTDILMAVVDTANDRVELAPQPLVDVASAATTDIGAVKSRNLRITGTATITSFGTVRAGTTRTLYFAAALTLTYNATSLITPTAANIAVSAGDSVDLVSLGSGNWRVLRHIPGTDARVKLSTTQTASGSQVDFTGIPAGVKRITIMVADLSTTSTGTPVLQLGDSGGIETTGYNATNTLIVNAGATSISSFTTPGFPFGGANAGNSYNGKIVLDLLSEASNVWVCSGLVGAATVTSLPSGYKATSAVLDRLRFIVGSSDTYDGGSINISWEF